MWPEITNMCLCCAELSQTKSSKGQRRTKSSRQAFVAGTCATLGVLLAANPCEGSANWDLFYTLHTTDTSFVSFRPARIPRTTANLRRRRELSAHVGNWNPAKPQPVSSITNGGWSRLKFLLPHVLLLVLCLSAIHRCPQW